MVTRREFSRIFFSTEQLHNLIGAFGTPVANAVLKNLNS
jgi:hypothetical protein